jgi:putative ABC transport system substrate-binding protein
MKLVGFVVATAIMVCVHLADAQRPAKVARIGFSSPGYEPSSISEAFVGGLRELGYIEGRNIAVEYRHGEGGLIGSPNLQPRWSV